MIARLLALLLLAALAGCTGRLEVAVDVMNPAYMRAATAEMAFINDANDLASGASIRADRVLQETGAELVQFGGRCLRGVIEKQQTALAGAADPQQAAFRQNINVATTSLAGLPGRIGQFQVPWRVRLRAADAAARTAVLRDLPQMTGLAVWHPPASGRPPVRAQTGRRPASGNRRATDQWPLAVPESVKLALAERQIEYDAYSSAVAGLVAQVGGVCGQAAAPQDRPAIAEETEAVKADTAELATSVVGGGTLMNHMTEAFFATKADEAVWAPEYNRAIGGGYNGNVSVALVMNDTADFR